MIVANWNRLVQPDEIVFHLGDLALGKREQAEALIPTLHGKIHLMRGNHDRRGRAIFEGLGIRLVKDPLTLDLEPWPRLIFSHRPVFPLPPGALNPHGHIHNNPHPADPKGLGDLWGLYVNMSIEVRDYRPWRLGEILSNL